MVHQELGRAQGGAASILWYLCTMYKYEVLVRGIVYLVGIRYLVFSVKCASIAAALGIPEG